MDHCFDWVAAHARRQPDRIAVATTPGTTLTWAELEGRVGRLAHLLESECKVVAGDRVALVAQNDARYFEVQFACIRLGAAFMPLSIRLAPSEMNAVLADADANVIVHDREHAAVVAGLTAVRGRPRTAVQWDASGRYAAVDDPGAPSLRARPVSADALAQILYTSGTTGSPKGVMTTNRGLAANAVNMAFASRLADREAHVLNYVPLFHAGGLNIMCNSVLYWGGRVTTTRTFDERQALDLLSDPDLGVTHINGVLQMYERIAALPDFDPAAFPTLRVAQFGGFGPDAPRTFRRWHGHGFALQLGYGSTELGPMAALSDAPDAEALTRGEFGQPLPLSEVRIVDEESTPVPPGATGEIQVRGPAVTAGYWGREARGPGDWLSIGDVGSQNAAGYLHVTGRLVERYRSGGENIYPAEVEAAYVDFPGVRELAAVGVPDATWGEVGLLVVVPEAGTTISLEQVRAHAAGRLARFKVPKHLRLVDALPRSTTEKVSRAQLRDDFVRAHAEATDL